MKCSECSRRNSDTNSFCIYCGTALTVPARQANNQPVKKLKVVLPPQDIDELISDRSYPLMYQSSRRRGVHPAVVVSLAIVLGLGGVYYWWFYRDAVNILAIDYQTTQLINE